MRHVEAEAMLFFGLASEPLSDKGLWTEDSDPDECVDEWCTQHKVQIVYYNYNNLDEPKGYIALESYMHRSCGLEVQEIDPAKLSSPTDEEIAALKDFCSKYGVEWENPGWKLVSWVNA